MTDQRKSLDPFHAVALAAAVFLFGAYVVGGSWTCASLCADRGETWHWNADGALPPVDPERAALKRLHEKRKRLRKLVDGTWRDDLPDGAKAGVVHAFVEEGAARWVGFPAGYVMRERLEFTEDGRSVAGRA